MLSHRVSDGLFLSCEEAVASCTSASAMLMQHTTVVRVQGKVALNNEDHGQLSAMPDSSDNKVTGRSSRVPVLAGDTFTPNPPTPNRADPPPAADTTKDANKDSGKLVSGSSKPVYVHMQERWTGHPSSRDKGLLVSYMQ